MYKARTFLRTPFLSTPLHNCRGGGRGARFNARWTPAPSPQAIISPPQKELPIATAVGPVQISGVAEVHCAPGAHPPAPNRAVSLRDTQARRRGRQATVHAHVADARVGVVQTKVEARRNSPRQVQFHRCGAQLVL